MDAVPVIARGHNVAVVLPPVTEALLPHLHAVTRRPAFVLAADADRAAEIADQAPGAFAVTGFERARKRLETAPPGVVCAGVADALTLLRRSALRPASFACVVLAWPDQFDAAGITALEAVMAECDRDAQRLVLVAAAGSVADGLVERYAFKAMTYGFPPAEKASGAPAAAPVGPARYVVARPSQLAETRRRVLDALNPDDDSTLVVAPCPASRAAAAELVERAAGGSLVVLAQAHQLAWLRTLFAPLSPLPLPTAAAELEQRADALRARLAKVAESEDLDRELFLVGPLLERFDAAVLAAAALRLMDAAGAPNRPVAAPAAPVMAGVAKVWVGIGRKDNVRPGDLVGALVNEAHVAADALGKIEVRELFSLVEVRADLAEQAAKGLSGATVRGRRLSARIDRGPGAKPPRRA